MSPELMQFVPYVILVILSIIPSWILFGRLGMSRAWALLSFVPLGIIIIVWIVAFRRWRNLPPQKA
jgi:hypothetical protein